MTRAENWKLILRLCELADDDAITSIRVALLNDFSTPEPFHPDNHLRHFVACLRRLFFANTASFPEPAPKTGLPLVVIPYATSSNLLNLRPVAQAAKQRGQLGLIVAGEGLRAGDLDGFGSVVSERNLWRKARKKGVLRIFRSARLKFRKLLALLEQLDGKCAQRVRQNRGLIFRHLIVSEAMRPEIKELMAEWRPSCLISTSDFWPFEFQCYAQARQLGIPTAMIQHGEFNDVIVWPTCADTLLLWGPVFRDKLLGLGAPEKRLRICGMPASDGLFLRRTGKGGNEGMRESPVCLLFSHAHDRWEEPALFETFDKFLREAIHSMPRVQWKIKLHPAEDDSFYREKQFTQQSRVEVLPRAISLEQAVEKADVVCTIRSTAGLQAMMMQRPLIVIDLVPGVDCSVSWPLAGGGLAAKTPQAFKNFLDRLVDDKEFNALVLKTQDAFLDRSFANKGGAATAVVDYLEEQSKPPAKTSTRVITPMDI